MTNPSHLLQSRDPETVREMFGSIARRYDLANRLLSCGCDFIWRKRAAKIVSGWNPDAIVDLATGTGDLALALATALPKSEIIGADFSPEMLAEAVRRMLGTQEEKL